MLKDVDHVGLIRPTTRNSSDLFWLSLVVEASRCANRCQRMKVLDLDVPDAWDSLHLIWAKTNT